MSHRSSNENADSTSDTRKGVLKSDVLSRSSNYVALGATGHDGYDADLYGGTGVKSGQYVLTEVTEEDDTEDRAYGQFREPTEGSVLPVVSAGGSLAQTYKGMLCLTGWIVLKTQLSQAVCIMSGLSLVELLIAFFSLLSNVSTCPGHRDNHVPLDGEAHDSDAEDPFADYQVMAYSCV